ncbi:hypothetical protein [Burkholderia plantarii]|uniref:hypothetical protein n=1 Tax=Burkholderia plantarii TaxID=41899 RepID=UPI0006D8C426|nr:hypothetical protein [Burkholderia plantarii]ALK35153.1 hypothetical protein bpln_1p0070 [Burkholderia plantarii]GLZ22493.1 hypothetical protein Bpla01_60220 [Burkholderia plantarii]
MERIRFTHFTSGVTMAPPRDGVPVAFARALQARVDYATAMFATDEGVARQALLRRAREEARDLAWDLVMIDDSDLSCPHLFADVPALREAFEDSVNWAQLERAELEDALAEVQAELGEQRAEAERREATEAAIAAGAWAALGLPTPEQFLQTLAARESVDVHGHVFDYVSDEGVWVTNPYGADVLVSMDPLTVTDARRVLAYLARGSTYGPVPPGSE